MNAPEQKEIVDEFVKESEAVRLMKLKEAVYHPKPSSQFLFVASITLFVGVSLCGSHFLRDGDLGVMALVGLVWIVMTLITIQEIRTRQIHDRIDKLLELKFEKPDKQRQI